MEFFGCFCLKIPKNPKIQKKLYLLYFQVGRLPEKFVGRISVAVVRGLTYLKDEIKILHRGIRLLIDLFSCIIYLFQMLNHRICLSIVTEKLNYAILESLECWLIRWPTHLSERGVIWRWDFWKTEKLVFFWKNYTNFSWNFKILIDFIIFS